MAIYLDTSALVKLYAEEEGREIVRNAVDESDRVVTSVVAYAETRAALARKQREGIFTEEQLRVAVEDFERDWGGFFWGGFFKVAASIPSAASQARWPKHTLSEASTPSTSQARSASKKDSTVSVSWPSTTD